MSKSKALVLHSGGLDSTVCLGLANLAFSKVKSVSVNYGQRHVRELLAAADISDHYGVEHEVLMLGLPSSMLTDKDIPIPNMSYSEIKGVSPTYVPFRNGSLLAMLAAKAQAEEYDAIFFGAHAEDAANWAYPDCTPEFIGAMANAIYIGTYHKVRLHTPLMWLMKSEIVELGFKHEVPLGMTWSCYVGGEKHCGVCPTCRSRKDAFRMANVPDPTDYAAKG